MIYQNFDGEYFVETGESRIPKKGDFYAFGGMAAECYVDHSYEQTIVKPEVFEAMFEPGEFVRAEKEPRVPKEGDLYYSPSWGVLKSFGSHDSNDPSHFRIIVKRKEESKDEEVDCGALLAALARRTDSPSK